MKIEQRIGRLHRILQTREVRAFSLCSRGSAEERILEVLDMRILFELVVGEVDLILGEPLTSLHAGPREAGSMARRSRPSGPCSPRTAPPRWRRSPRASFCASNFVPSRHGECWRRLSSSMWSSAAGRTRGRSSSSTTARPASWSRDRPRPFCERSCTATSQAGGFGSFLGSLGSLAGITPPRAPVRATRAYH